MTKRWLPDYVSEYSDRHGKKRYRYRRKGFKPYSFKNPPTTKEFLIELAKCENGTAAPALKSVRTEAGSFDDLIARYYRSPDFLDPGPRTQVVYRNALEAWRSKPLNEGKRVGQLMVKHLQAKHVEIFMTEMLPHRTAANMLRKRLNALMNFAVRQEMALSNPVPVTRPFKIEGDGFHTWSEEEIEAFENRHQVGSMSRLAFDLLLWSGQRRGDMSRMGPQHVRHGRLEIRQEKTGKLVSVPVLAPLAASILATPMKGLIFVTTSRGVPFSKAGIGNWFRDRCDEAGLPECTAHGLRKAAARRLAEAGCTNQEIKSWTGHTTDSEVARYTAAASATMLSDAAAERLMTNLRNRLANRHVKGIDNAG